MKKGETTMNTKTISSILSAVLAAGTFSAFPVMAEEDPVVYTYTNE